MKVGCQKRLLFSLSVNIIVVCFNPKNKNIFVVVARRYTTIKFDNII